MKNFKTFTLLITALAITASSTVFCAQEQKEVKKQAEVVKITDPNSLGTFFRPVSPVQQATARAKRVSTPYVHDEDIIQHASCLQLNAIFSPRISVFEDTLYEDNLFDFVSKTKNMLDESNEVQTNPQELLARLTHCFYAKQKEYCNHTVAAAAYNNKFEKLRYFGPNMDCPENYLRLAIDIYKTDKISQKNWITLGYFLAQISKIKNSEAQNKKEIQQTMLLLLQHIKAEDIACNTWLAQTVAAHDVNVK